jgi:hypothetical protein
MSIACNELQQTINSLLISFKDCNKIKNSDLRKLVDLSVSLYACSNGGGGETGDIQHNATENIQGGSLFERFHLTQEQYDNLEFLTNKVDSLDDEGYTEGDDFISFYTTVKAVNDGLSLKVDKVAGKSLVSDTEITKLANLDNTKDVDKPVSIAQNIINNQKLDKGNFVGTAETLNTKIDSILANSTIVNNVTTSSTVPSTGNIHAIGIGPGTYPNWGGMVIPPNNIGTLQRVNGVYSVNLTPIDLSRYDKTEELSKKADIVVGKNLFDKAKITPGKYVDGTNGMVQPLAGYNSSDFIPVLPSTNYYLSNSGNGYRAYYDANKIYISGTNIGSTNGILYATPANAYFIRITCIDAKLNTTQLESGTVATVYEPYKELLHPKYGVALNSELQDSVEKTTELDNRATALEEDLLFLIPEIQTHLSEQNGYIENVGSLNTNSSFKIRVFDLTNIAEVRVQLGTLGASGANAFAFYSATSAFGISNYMSGTTFATLSNNGKDMTVVVPAGALRLLICEFNANIATYTITGYVYSSVIANHEERITELENKIGVKNIICRGDSITAGTAGSYPGSLQTLLGANYSVVNLGVGSAHIQDISARQGGVPFLLLNDLAIPADNTTQVSVPSSGVFNKYQSSGIYQIAPRFNIASSILDYSPCMIDNEEFVMTLTDPGSGIATVTIRRVTAGDAFTIKAGTPIYPNSLKVYRDVLATVFFMGTNNTQSHTLDLPTYADTIVNYHKDCIKILKDSNYLILGLFNISHRMYNRDLASSVVTNAELLAQHVAYELKMENEFGLHFINLRKYLASPKSIKDAVRLGYMTQGTADTNAANDVIWQNKGCAAYSFMVYQSGNDFVHPNAVGYKMIAWYVHNWLKKYLKNV